MILLSLFLALQPAIAGDLKVGDTVIYNVFGPGKCLATIKSFEQAGEYARLDVSPVGCDHDPGKLFRTRVLQPVKLEPEAVFKGWTGKYKYSVGASVVADRMDFMGKSDGKKCEGVIEAITDNQYAKVKYLTPGCFDDSTFTIGRDSTYQTSNRLMSLNELTPVEVVIRADVKGNVFGKGQKIYFEKDGKICTAVLDHILSNGYAQLKEVKECSVDDHMFYLGAAKPEKKPAPAAAEEAPPASTGSAE